jgi:hypothetical protein
MIASCRGPIRGIWPKTLDDALARMSRQRRVFSIITDGAARSHGFAWYADGVRRRAWLSVDGEIVFQDGAPLTEEAATFAEERDDERHVFVLRKILTGVDLVPTTAVRFTVYEVQPAGSTLRFRGPMRPGAGNRFNLQLSLWPQQ